MKVMMISRKFGPLSEMSFGPFPMIYKLVNGLNKKIDLAILSSYRWRPLMETVEGVKVYRTFFPPIDDMIKWFFMPHVIFENGAVNLMSPDILHSQDIEGGFLFRKYRYSGVRKIFSIKSAIAFRTKNRNPNKGFRQKIYNKTLDFWERMAINYSDYYVTPTVFLRNEISDYYKLDDSKFFLIKNGTFTDMFRPNSNVSKLRKKYGLKDERVLFSTSTGWRKGLDALFKAFNIIKKDNPDIKLIVAGPSEFGDFEKFIDKKIIDINKDIILLGHIKDYELPEYYNMAKLFLLPSFMETQSNVIIESMSCGTPTITFNSGALPETVSNKEGVLVETGDVDGFAEAALRLLGNEVKLKKLSANCRKRALRDYKIEKTVDEHIKMYNQITD